MIQNQRTIFVTGANRGLGYGIVESLCKHNPLKLKIIMSARSKEKGVQVLEKLKKEYPYNKQQIDILVNNAGVYPEQGDGTPSVVQDTLQINFLGTVNFTKLVNTMLTSDAKVIFLSSGYGKLTYQTDYAKDVLQNSKVKEEELFSLANEYIQLAETNPKTNKFKITQPYFISKALLNAWVRWIGSKNMLPKQNMFLVCPGWCRTDMGGPNAYYSPEQGISYPLELINKFPFERSDRSAELYSYGKLSGF